MEIKLKGRRYLVPFEPDWYYWYRRRGMEVSFLQLSDRNKRGYKYSVCMHCGNVETRIGFHYAEERCSDCGYYYNSNDRTTFIAHGHNTLVTPPKIITHNGVKIVSFYLCEFQNDEKTDEIVVKRRCKISYSRENGIVWDSLGNKDAKSFQMVKVDLASKDEPIVKELVKAFEKVHPSSGVMQTVLLANEKRSGFNLKVLINYFMYLKKYPHLEQLSKSGYGQVLADILRFSSTTINRKMKELFNEGTKEKDIVRLPSYIRDFIKTDKDMDNKRVVALMEYFANEPKISKEVFEMFRKAFPCYIVAKWNIGRLKDETGYTLPEICKLVLNNQTKENSRRVMGMQRDYVRMCCEMGFPYERFPKNVRKVHDEVAVKYKVQKDELTKITFAKKVEEYKDLRLHSGDYFIRCPESMEELIREGQIMHHCVGSYTGRFAAGTSLIFFMRKTSEPNNPYITMEFNSAGRLVQAHKSYNRSINDRTESALIQQFRTDVLCPSLKKSA